MRYEVDALGYAGGHHTHNIFANSQPLATPGRLVAAGQATRDTRAVRVHTPAAGIPRSIWFPTRGPPGALHRITSRRIVGNDDDDYRMRSNG